VSVGPNRYGHPVPAVLTELARDGMRVFRTDRSGDVTVAFLDGGGVSVESSHDG
jgi:competence protein ComEC